MTELEKEQSEFGKGFIYCIGLFLVHAAKYQEMLVQYKEMAEKNPDLFSEAGATSMWANGASDHFYEFTIPDAFRKANPEMTRRAEEMKRIALDMGHGNGLMNKHKYGREDVFKLIKTAKDLCLAIDQWLGIKCKKAEWA